jgi:hypothetical protein
MQRPGADAPAGWEPLQGLVIVTWEHLKTGPPRKLVVTP